MTATLASLQTPLTQTQIFQILLGVYQAAGFPTQAWQTGGVERTRLMAISTGLLDVSANYIPAFANGLFVDYSTSDGNGGGWLPLMAEQLYSVIQNAAISTQGTVTLTSAAGVGAQTVAAGNLIIVFAASGNRYMNIAPITIAAGPGSVSGPFQAEFPGSAYADPSSSGAITLVTPVPGVSITNPAGPFSTQIHVGSGTGTLTLGGSPVGPHSVVVTLTSTGASGVASWSYALDGAPSVSAGAVATLTNVGGTGINITLANGVSGASFVLGDTYQFNTPGSWITQQGANIESDTALRLRCKNRWATLSGIPTEGYYIFLATSTPTVGAQVTQAIVLVDSVTNNKVNIIVAGPGGVLPGATITTIQNFITPLARGTDTPVVQSPASLNITFSGNIIVTSSLQAEARTAVQAAMTNLVNAAGINGTIRIASVIDAIMNIPGIIDVDSVTINGAPANLVLGSPTSFVLGSLQPLGFGYVSV